MKQLLLLLLVLVCAVGVFGQVTQLQRDPRLLDALPATPCSEGDFVQLTIAPYTASLCQHALWAPVDTAGGTVTSVSGTANQINVATGTTTPALTLSSTIIAPGTVTATTSVASPFFVSADSNPADAGAIRLGSGECVEWEANTPGTDLTLCKNASDIFAFSAGVTAPTVNGLTITANGTNTLNIAAGQTLTVTTGGTLGSAAYTAASAYEVPLTFSTGLTRSTNTVTVNTSQNIATLSNLTTNGLVTTGGAAGTLSVTAPGTGVLTALGVNVGSAGALVTFNGAGGTPSSLTGTNISGTAASLTAGAVTGFTAGAGVLTGPASAGVSATLGNNETITGIKTFSPTARSSGSAAYMTINTPADTGISTATESIGVNHVTATRTWVDGTVALQRENFFAGPTYNKTTTSATFTDTFTLYATPPVAGTGVTFTRGHTLGIVDSTSASSSITGGLVVATTLGTTATSVGIGGGNINAGGNGTFGGTLNVTGTSTLGAGTSSLTTLGTITTGTWNAGAVTSNTSLASINAGSGNAQRMTLQNNLGASYAEQGTDGRFRVGNTGTSGTPDMVVGHIGATGDGNLFLSTNNTTRMTIGSGGTITLTTNITNAAGTPGSICYNTSTFELTKNNALTCTVSSKDFKQGITNLTQLSAFDKLRPVEFAYRDRPLRSRWGFIAEEAAGADHRFADGYDDKGIPRSLDQNGILAATVKEVQQLKVRVAAQAEEIKTLKAVVKQ